MIWLALLLLGLTTYLVVQRSVARVTRTPWWILWLTLMMPAFVIGTWALTHGENEPIPLVLLIGPFLLCTIVYFLLVQWGRIRGVTPSSANNSVKLAEVSASKPVISPMDKTEETTLQSCFPWSIYYLQSVEYRPQAVICRGQLRSTPEVAYQTVRDNIAMHFGDRFLIVFQAGAGNKPFFALVPNFQARNQAKGQTKPVTRPVLALGLLIITLFTTTLAGVEIANGAVSLQTITSNPAMLQSGLAYALSLLIILGIHELGHYFTTRFYKVRASLPYFIPIPFALGTFGAFIQMRSPVPNRKALFDIAIAGPVAGFVVTLPILIWGLAHSQVVPLTGEPEIFNFRAFNPSFSILLALLSKVTLGSALAAGKGIDLHPLAVSGCLGLVVTALNLMPIGQLDGGHIVHAMFGQRSGAAIGQISRLLVLLLSLAQPWLLFWAIILFFLPAVDEPALNDVSELDNRRDLLGLLALGLLLLIILPMPRLLTDLFLANPVP